MEEFCVKKVENGYLIKHGFGYIKKTFAKDDDECFSLLRTMFYSPNEKSKPAFKVGDRVKIVGPWEKIKDMKQEPWAIVVYKMKEEIGKSGFVTLVTDYGWVEVDKNWFWPPEALELIQPEPVKESFVVVSVMDTQFQDLETARQKAEHSVGHGQENMIIAKVLPGVCRSVKKAEWS